MGTRGPAPKRRPLGHRTRAEREFQPTSKVTTYDCGCVYLSGYDSLGRQGWRRRCDEHKTTEV